MREMLIATALSLWFSACAQQQATSLRLQANADPSPTRIGALAPRELEGGSCGLFLWSRTAPPRFVFFADSRDGSGAIALDGAERLAARTSFSGSEHYGHYEEQTFETRSGYKLELNFKADPNAALINGVQLPRGLLKLFDDKGGYEAVPVAGLIGCQAS